MIDNPFRRILPDYTLRFLRFFKVLHAKPNHISAFAFLLSLVAGFLIIKDHFYWAIAIWWLSRLFDGIDGIYARHYGMQSAFGAYVDIVLDMAAYSVIMIALLVVFPHFYILIASVLILYTLCITSALALGNMQGESASATENRGLRLGAGLAEGGETGIAYTVFLLFPSHLEYLLPIWITILAITVLARTFLAYKTL